MADQSTKRTPKVFISYRRDDTGGDAGRLNDTLIHILGRERTFFDLEQIGPGVDFEIELKRALSTSEVFLALIGPKWERAIDSSGKPRLSDESDLVRIELLTALKSKTVRVVPILLNRDTIPNREDLPDVLHPITRLNAFEIRRDRWDDDVAALLKKLGISQSHPHPPISAVVEWKRKNEPDSTPRRWVVYIHNYSDAQITIEEVKVSSPSRKLTIDWGPIPPKAPSDYELEESEFDPSGERPKVYVRFHDSYGRRWALHEGVFHPIDG
jgi:hypothetical protein